MTMSTRAISQQTYRQHISCLYQNRTFSSSVSASVSPSVSVSQSKLCRIDGISTIRVHGPDTQKFLQGMITNDISRLSRHDNDNNNNNMSSMYTAWLHPKGRTLFDSILIHESFGKSSPIVFHHGARARTTSNDHSGDSDGHNDGQDSFLVQVDSRIVPLLMRHLKLYRLRSKVQIDDATDEYHTYCLSVSGDNTQQLEQTAKNLHHYNLQKQSSSSSSSNGHHILAFTDPRLYSMGARMLLPASTHPDTIHDLLPDDVMNVPSSHYTALRMTQGVAEGPQDMEPMSTFALESNIHWLNGVHFEKGCYLGQELIARTHFKGVIRKRIMPVIIIPTHTLNAEGEGGPLPAGVPPIRVASAVSASAVSGDGDGSDMDTHTYDVDIALNPMNFVREDVDYSNEPALIRTATATATSMGDNGAGDSDGDGDDAGTILMGKQKVGRVLSVYHNIGLARLRLAQTMNPKQVFRSVCGEWSFIPYIPHWWPDHIEK
jgi:transferase CAF17, mitochondrial